MYDAVEAIRERVTEGLPAWVLCFDDSPSNDRDASMARQVLAHRSEHPDSKYVLLMGNVHSRSAQEPGAKAAYAPMAWHLRQAEERVSCVKIRHTGGGFWCCTPDGCGIQMFGGRATGQGLQLFAERDGNGYDGVFDLGRVHASPPAVSKPINATCPRSGKPVVDHALAHYRGRLVGFCNTGCRDDFEAHVADRPDDRRMFDALIESVDSIE
jgi:hypothetical protein